MAEAAAAAARQARVAHLSIDAGALEGGAEGGGLHAFEAASQELQSPIAAVRQRAIADNTFTCCELSHLRERTRKPCPAARTRSATSSGGFCIYLGFLSEANSNESSGESMLPRCRAEICR